MKHEAAVWRRLDALLEKLFDAEPEEREQILVELERAEPEMGSQARRLLAAAEAGPIEQGGALGEHILDRLTDAVAADDISREALPYAGSVGPWRLLEELGRGGMGVVYLAEPAEGEPEGRARAVGALIRLQAAAGELREPPALSSATRRGRSRSG